MANWWQRGKAMKERVTLENLTAMVKQGFDQVDKRFVAIGRRLEGLEQGQDDIRLHLEQAAYRLELVELTHRMQRIEGKVGLAGS